MNTDHKSTGSSSRFLERIIGVAGGAILAGSLGIWIFNSLDRHFPNELVAAIAGMAGGLVSILQRRWNRRKQQGEKID